MAPLQRPAAAAPANHTEAPLHQQLIYKGFLAEASLRDDPAPSTRKTQNRKRGLAVLRLPLLLQLSPKQFEQACQANHAAVLDFADDDHHIALH